MASKAIKGLMIEIGGDTSSLGKALKETEDNISSVSKELREVERGLKFNPGNMELLAQKSELTAKQIENTTKQLNTFKEAQSQVQAQFDKGDIGEEQYRAFQRDIIKTESQLGGLKTKLSETNTQMDNGGVAVDKLGNELQKTEKKASIFGDVLKANLAADAIKAGLSGLKNALEGIGSTFVKVSKAMIDSTIAGAQYADDILTLSAQTGIATDSLEGYKYAAELVDVSIETLTGSMAKNIKSMTAATDATKGVGKIYADLGVDVRDSNGALRDSEKVYWETIDALGAMADGTERDAHSMEIFGKSAQELNPLMQTGSEGIKALTDEAREMGAIVGGEALAAFGEFEDTMQRWKGTMDGLKNTIGIITLPMLQELGDVAVSELGKFSKALQDAGGDPEKIAEVITAALSSVLNVIMEQLPVIAENLADGVSVIGESLIRNLPSLSESVIQIIDTIFSLLTENLPIILDIGFQLLDTLSEGILAALPLLPEMATQIIIKLATSLIEALPDIIKSGIEIIISLALGIGEALPELVPIIVETILTIVDILVENIPLLADAAIAIMIGLSLGLVEALPILIEKAPIIIEKLVVAIVNNIPRIIQVGIEVILTLVKSLIDNSFKILVAAEAIVFSLFNAFLNFKVKIKQIGVNIMTSIWDGIANEIKGFDKRLTSIFNGWLSVANEFIVGLNKIFDTELQPFKLSVDPATVAKLDADSKKAYDALESNQNSAYRRVEEKEALLEKQTKKTSDAFNDASKSTLDYEAILAKVPPTAEKVASSTKAAGGAAKSAADEAVKAEKDKQKELEELRKQQLQEANELGDALTEALKRQMRAETDAMKEAIQAKIDLIAEYSYDEIDASKEVSETKIKLLNEEYISKVKGIDEGLGAFLSASNQEIQKHIDIIALTDKTAAAKLQAIQDEIDGINNLSEKEQSALNLKNDNAKRATIEEKIRLAESQEDQEKLLQELVDFEDEIKRKKRDTNRKNQLKDLEEQKKATLDSAKETIAEQTKLAAEIAKNQTKTIDTTITDMKTGKFTPEDEKQSLTSLEEAYKNFEETAVKAAAQLVNSGKDGQNKALQTLQTFYPDWKDKGKKFTDYLKQGIDDGSPNVVEAARLMGQNAAQAFQDAFNAMKALLDSQKSSSSSDAISSYSMASAFEGVSPMMAQVQTFMDTESTGLSYSLSDGMGAINDVAQAVGVSSPKETAPTETVTQTPTEVTITNNFNGVTAADVPYKVDRANKKALRILIPKLS